MMSAAKATGSRVEVAAGERLVRVREDERIVRDAVRFEAQRRSRVTQDVQRGAHHLRLAAQAVGVLHARVAHEMRGADGGARHQRAQRCRGFDLPAMTAQLVDAGVEGRVGALSRLRSRARR